MGTVGSSRQKTFWGLHEVEAIRTACATCIIFLSSTNGPFHQFIKSIFTAAHSNWSVSPLEPRLHLSQPGGFHEYGSKHRVEVLRRADFKRAFCFSHPSSLPVKTSQRDGLAWLIFNVSIVEWHFKGSYANNLTLCAIDWEDTASSLQIFDHHSCGGVYHRMMK